MEQVAKGTHEHTSPCFPNRDYVSGTKGMAFLVSVDTTGTKCLPRVKRIMPSSVARGIRTQDLMHSLA
jgi:hypothetical protein